jgi:hypothetical protein
LISSIKQQIKATFAPFLFAAPATPTRQKPPKTAPRSGNETRQRDRLSAGSSFWWYRGGGSFMATKPFGNKAWAYTVGRKSVLSKPIHLTFKDEEAGDLYVAISKNCWTRVR